MSNRIAIPKKIVDNSQINKYDQDIKIMQTKGQKPNFNYVIPKEELSYKPIIANQKDPNKINIDWSYIIGYNSIKNLLNAVLKNKNKKKTHVLIAGSAGTSKTVFLKTIEQSLRNSGFNVHYLDSTTLTSSGVIEYLFNNNVEYCLLDEIDKLEKEHQKTFLNLLESGILQETKHRKIRKKEMFNTIIIATANYLDKIMSPLKTRFLALEIPEYSQDQFYEIAQQLLIKQYSKNPEIAYYITDQIWQIFTNKKGEKPNMRNCVQVAVLTDNTKESIDPILRGIADYSLKVEVE